MKTFYIFLDIDGVLNNKKYIEKCYKRHHKPMHMNHVPFDPKCLTNLMILVQTLEKKEYDVQIILSSTWRLNKIDYEIVDARLAEYGLCLNGKTPYINGERGKEIKEFLKDKNYENIIILDDDIQDIIEQFEDINIINTKFNTGFNSEKLEEAIEKGGMQICKRKK